MSGVMHYRIMSEPASGKLYVENTAPRFVNLRELLDSYISSGDRNGLACALRQPYIEIGAVEHGKYEWKCTVHASL